MKLNGESLETVLDNITTRVGKIDLFLKLTCFLFDPKVALNGLKELEMAENYPSKQ